MTENRPVYRIRQWSELYETAKLPNSMTRDGYGELMDHPNGAAHYGAWVALVVIASTCDPRGTLVYGANGASHTPVSFSHRSRIPASVFEEAIPRLVHIGWLEVEPEEARTARLAR